MLKITHQQEHQINTINIKAEEALELFKTKKISPLLFEMALIGLAKCYHDFLFDPDSSGYDINILVTDKGLKSREDYFNHIHDKFEEFCDGDKSILEPESKNYLLNIFILKDYQIIP